MQEYKITVYVQEVLKGNARNKYVFKGFSIYNDADKAEIAIGSCSLDIDLGKKYVVFIEEGKKIKWDGCSEHILPKG